MDNDLMSKWELSRRRVLAGAAGLGLAGASSAAFGQSAGPWELEMVASRTSKSQSFQSLVTAYRRFASSGPRY